MPPERNCEECGAELPVNAPLGLCPRCLARMALSSVPTAVLPRSDFQIERTGVMIGRYKLLEKIGEGGFGVVFMAEQVEPVQRKVALKIIKAGMDTKEVIARFEAERQAIALMDHPNIARALDAGTTEAGRPYFVMELVRGIPITDYCDQEKLPTSERLQLFMKVCHAVQHAHLKGVIHRDIKPSNVLVTLHDGEPVPKVIDFGVVKALGQKLTEKTLFTGFQHMIGTPAYMSPEQAALSGLDIDTRADIYSLGVLLYELLTGVTPFDADTFRKAALDEIRRMIRETEPPKPSTRLQTIGDKLTEVARHRRAEPAALSRLVRGDLDWIVMKCLEKDRKRRYETANGLAMDLQRHLDSEPVVARPPSSLYQFQKLVRRHRFAFVASGAVAASLVVGLGVSTVLFIQERQALRRADKERQRADLNAASELLQRQAAERERETSRQRLVRLNVANGMKLLESGDSLGALPWFADALVLDRGNARQEKFHRLRLASVIGEAPKLVQCWFLSGRVDSAEFSKDGRFVITAGEDHTARVWDVATGQPASPLLSHGGEVCYACFSPDDSRVLTAATDNARIWNTRTWEVEFTLDHDALEDAKFSPDGQLVATASSNGSIKIWKVSNGRQSGPVLQHTTRPRSGQNPQHLNFSPDGKRLLTASYDSTACVWDLKQGILLFNLRHNNVVRYATYSRDGMRIATACWANTAHLWDAADGRALAPPLAHDGMVDHVAFSPDDLSLVSSSIDGKVRIWDAANGASVRTIETGGFVMESVFSPDGSLFVTRGFSGAVRAWHAGNGLPASAPLLHTGWPASVRFHPDGRRVLTACVDGIVRLWDLQPDGLSFNPWSRERKTILNCSPQGNRIVTGNPAGLLQVWDVGSWQSSCLALSVTNPLRCVLFSADGKRLLTVEQMAPVAEKSGSSLEFTTREVASGEVVYRMMVSLTAAEQMPGRFCVNADATRVAFSRGRIVELMDLMQRKSLWVSRPQDTTIRFICFSPDGQRLLFNSGLLVHVVDAASGNDLYPPLTNNLASSSAEFSPDGRLVVTTGTDVSYDDGEARLWNALTGQLISRLKHVDGVLCASFSPDARMLATGAESQSGRVFEVNTGKPITPWHAGGISSVAFSPDGRMLATANGGTARVWDVSTGEAITPPLKHSGSVGKVQFLSNGQYLATESGNARQLWKLQPDPRPLEDVALHVCLLTGHHVDETGILEPLGFDTLSNSWNYLHVNYPADFRFSERVSRSSSSRQDARAPDAPTP